MHSDYEVWYAKASRLTYRWYMAMQCAAILCGFFASVIVARTPHDEFHGLRKIVIVALPMLGGLAASAIVQFKLYDIWWLRGDGRVEFQRLITQERVLVAALKDDEEATAIHKALQEQAQEIEIQQIATFVGLLSRSYTVQYNEPSP